MTRRRPTPPARRRAPRPQLRRISVFLDVTQLARLQAIHARTDVPVSSLIRRGVDLVLDQWERAPVPAPPPRPTRRPSAS